MQMLLIESELRITMYLNVMMTVYLLVVCVLLLNMLIGILSTTFQNVKDNCEIEWKYAMSQQLEVWFFSDNLKLN